MSMPSMPTAGAAGLGEAYGVRVISAKALELFCRARRISLLVRCATCSAGVKYFAAARELMKAAFGARVSQTEGRRKRPGTLRPNMKLGCSASKVCSTSRLSIPRVEKLCA